MPVKIVNIVEDESGKYFFCSKGLSGLTTFCLIFTLSSPRFYRYYKVNKLANLIESIPVEAFEFKGVLLPLEIDKPEQLFSHN